jgi:hypothetical protein
MTTTRLGLIALMAVAVAWGQAGAAAAAPLTGAQVCASAKLTAAGKKEQCLAEERAKEVRGKVPNYAACSNAFTGAFARAETKAGAGVCPSEGDAGTVEALIDGCFVELDAALGGTPGSVCVPGAAFPATGQTTCSNSTGTVIACAGTGQDGDITAGGALSYTDNGDGTITDNNTGLMWEKKSREGTTVTNSHHRDKRYAWADASAVHTAGLNAGSGFAGHTDWRVPNAKELQSIVNYENLNPAVSPEFEVGCVASCTVLNCSCTAASFTWTSTTGLGGPGNAWSVNFSTGAVSLSGKGSSRFVRAVRGGI